MFRNEIENSMSAFMDVSFDYIYLPPEIISKIYSFIVLDRCNEIIYKHCSNYIKQKIYMSQIIMYCLTPYNFSPQNPYHPHSPVYALEFLVKANITKKYDLNIWSNILQILSEKIHLLRFTQICQNVSNKSYYGKSLVRIAELWLQLCKKFNFKLLLCTKKFSKYVMAQHVPKMNNYDKYLITPIVVKPFTQTESVDTVLAYNYLLNYYYL